MKTHFLLCCWFFLGLFSQALSARDLSLAGSEDMGFDQQTTFLKNHLLEHKTIDCSNIKEFVTTYLQIATTHQNLLTHSIRRFKSQLLNEESQSREDKKNLKEDLLKTLMLLEDTELVLQDKAQYIQMVLPRCLKAPEP